MKTLFVYALSFFLYLSFHFAAYAQAPSNAKFIKGRVVDGETSHAVEYVTVAAYKKTGSKFITGTVTDANGEFLLKNIEAGNYFIQISFMGYQKLTIPDLSINMEQPTIDLGTIKLDRDENLIKAVEVTADRPAVDYQIDKKVVNVSEQYTSVGGTAIDVLENVPSVTVDVDGNVSLRGSSGFTVLIDGKPSVLEGSEALEQIPASTIENIEIITNPSVKYDPDGTSGIINVITKKNKMKGLNGIVNLNLGLDEKYGGDILLNFKKNILNFYVSADYNDRKFPGFSFSERQTTINDTVYSIVSEGNNNSFGKRWSIRSGIALQPDSNNSVSLDFRYGYGKWHRLTSYDYMEKTEPSSGIFNTSSFDDSQRSGNFFSVDLQYAHHFAGEGHKLIIQANYSDRIGTESHQNSLVDDEGTTLEAQLGTEDGPSHRYEIQADYTLPLREKDKFEAGYQIRNNYSEDNTGLYLFNENTNELEFQQDYSNETKYYRDIHSLYGLYAGELNKFGYQAGLRGEYTLRRINSGSFGDFVIDRWDYFPTLHLSYSFNKKYQLMSSYSRRIDRPRGWWLEPFLTWEDAYNVRRGNPNLQPEYIDALELNFIVKMDKNFFSVEGYHRITNNYIDYVRSVYSENVILSNPENVGKAFSTGAEVMLNYDIIKNWQINLSGNIYNYRVEGQLFNQDFSNESLNWNSRLNNNFKITRNLQIQLTGLYNSPTATSQGTTEGYFSADGALRANFFDRKFSAILQVRDIFQSAKQERTTHGKDFFYHDRSYRKAPFVMLSLSYKFNNFKNDGIQGINDMGGGGGGEEF